MTRANLKTTVRGADEHAIVIEVHGEINAFAENTLMDAYTQANSGGIKAIILNFEGLEYMNSGGIGLLVTLLIRAQRQGQRLLACGLSEHYQHIFELTRLSEAISLYPTEGEALAAIHTLVA